MDISKWPLERIMQLPEDCFGTRFTMFFSKALQAGNTLFELSKLGLPNRCVLYEISFGVDFLGPSNRDKTAELSLSLASRVPVDNTAFRKLEPLWTGVNEVSSLMSIIRSPMFLSRMRMPIPAQGRHVVTRVRNIGAVDILFSVGLVFSSIPNEVPDYYSGPLSEKMDKLIEAVEILNTKW